MLPRIQRLQYAETAFKCL